MFFLKRNLPHWERALRIAAGVGVAAYAWTALPPGMLNWAAWATVATLVGTAFVGFCPACAMVGRKPLGK